MFNDRKKFWKRVEKMALIITSLAAIVTIIGFLFSVNSTSNSYDENNNTGMIINGNYGTINFNYSEYVDDNISLIWEELLDLSYAGIYPLSREGMVDVNYCTYYKKGAVINLEFENKSNYSKIITNIDFIVNDITEIGNCEVDFIPVDFEENISIYAINNGNTDIEDLKIELGSTFNDIWGRESDINYETMDSLILELSHGEIRKICQYSYNDLLRIFNARNDYGWLHVFVNNSNNKMINFEPFICNIVYDVAGIYSIINQGGGGPYNEVIPIFIDGKTSKIEMVNNHPEIKRNGTTGIQFLILPNKSIEIDFQIEIGFSDNTKVESKKYTARFLVPIYNDDNDYLLLQEAIMRSRSEKLLYGRDENIDSSFLYNPKKFYENIWE